MVKKKILKKQKKSLSRKPEIEILDIKDFKKFREVDPFEYLLNEENIAKAIFECLMNNDPDGVMEVVDIYVNAVNKSKLLKRADMPRSTFYNLLKNRNPTIKTLAKLIHATSK